jgi:hypothetical protein
MTPDISHLNCTKREKQMIKELFDKHQDVFTKDDTDLGFSTTVQHRINNDLMYESFFIFISSEKFNFSVSTVNTVNLPDDSYS